MRVILVGPSYERTRLRAELDGNGFEIVAEFPTLTDARAAHVAADVVMLAANRAGPEIEAHEGGLKGDRPYEEPLTPREVQVLELLAEGLPNKAIAARLQISDQTVKFHVASIAGKLGAANRTDVVRRAVRRGLIAL